MSKNDRLHDTMVNKKVFSNLEVKEKVQTIRLLLLGTYNVLNGTSMKYRFQ